MTENFNYLFQYLEKKNIKVDKTEFLFQIQSHPDYPSILSIADALSFFNIKNGVIRIDSDKIEQLPEHFIAVLIEENDRPTLDTALYFVEQKGANYFCTKDKKPSEIAKAKLESRWNGVALLLEKTENEEAQKHTNNNWFWTLQILALLLFLLVLFQNETAFTNNLFFVFPIVGILFSVAALKDLFGTKSELLNNFCNLTASTSCESVVGSNKWKFFEIVSFSDLSIAFFSFQFLGLFFSFLSNTSTSFFQIQEILLFCSIPVIFISLYYQKFVEKKWCPICLVIISIVLLELGYLIVFQNLQFTISTKALVDFGFVFLSVILIWSSLKKLLISQKELKEFHIKGNRFMRNYVIFKNTLVSKQKIQLPESYLLFGNKESKTIITIISNPFCSHCKDAHEIIETILEKHYNDLQIQIILKSNFEKENEESKNLFRSLINIYRNEGEANFTKALKTWFVSKNKYDWFTMFPLTSTTEFDLQLKNQYKWCEENDFSFTPTIFINGYEYPEMYDRDNLEYFINELLEDSF